MAIKCALNMYSSSTLVVVVVVVVVVVAVVVVDYAKYVQYAVSPVA